VSRSDNIKRAKLLRKKKKEREKQNQYDDQFEKDQQELIQRANEEGNKVYNRSELGKKEKISTLVLEMIFPLLKTAYDEKDTRGIISLGVAAWNAGIIKSTLGEKEMNNLLRSNKVNITKEELRLLEDYIDLKCNKYDQYKDFITDFKISFEKGGILNFTVLTGEPFNKKKL
jgi:hypothetical protein